MSNYYSNNPTSVGYQSDLQVMPEPAYTQPIEDNPPARSINIQPLDHGYVVNIGCQTFAATDTDEMIDKIKVYLKNPWDTEKLWFEKRDLTLIK